MTEDLCCAAAYLFEDLIVSAYAGIMDQFQADQAVQQQIMKILSVDSYHSGLVRSWLFSNGANPIQWFSSFQVLLHSFWKHQFQRGAISVCPLSYALDTLCWCGGRTMHAATSFCTISCP